MWKDIYSGLIERHMSASRLTDRNDLLYKIKYSNNGFASIDNLKWEMFFLKIYLIFN